MEDKNSDCMTPLHYAAMFGSPEMIKLLLKMGSDYTKLTKSGASVMHLAAIGDNAFAIAFFQMKYKLSSD